MSCRQQAAQSSSRSTASPSSRPSVASWSTSRAPASRRAGCARRARRTRRARFITLARRTSSSSGSGCALSSRLEKDPLAPPGLCDFHRLKTAGTHHAEDDQRAGEDQVRPGRLDPGMLARSAAGSAASCSISSSSQSRSTITPARHRSRRRVPVGRRPRGCGSCRRRQPGRPSGLGEPVGLLELAGHEISQRAQLDGGLAGPFGAGALGHAHRAERPRGEGPPPAPATRTICIDPPPSSSTQPSSSVVELTAARSP